MDWKNKLIQKLKDKIPKLIWEQEEVITNIILDFENVCSNCGKEISKCNCIDVGTTNREEQIKRLKADIKDLKEKLLFVYTKAVKPNMHEGLNIAETQRKNEVRDIRGLLKDKLTTYEMIKKAEVILETKEKT